MWQPNDSFTPPERPPYEALLKAAQAVDVACRPFDGRESEQARSGSIPVLDFHSSVLPDVPLQLYAHGLAVRSGYGADGFAVAMALVARFAVDTGRGLTPLTMHRLFAVCMHVGMKACSDCCLTNKDFAAVAGFACSELNGLEGRLLHALDFRALPRAQDVTAFPIELAELFDQFCAGTLSTAVFPIVSDDSGGDDKREEEEDDDDDDESLVAPFTVSSRAFYAAVCSLLRRRFGGGHGGSSSVPQPSSTPDSAHIHLGNDDSRASDSASSE